MNFKTRFRQLKNTVTPDIASALINNIWGIVKGPMLLLFIPMFLSETTQGYWFTFGSLAALATFADLGFTAIVGQFSAHEYAHLSINKQGVLEGDKFHLERIVTLFRFVIKWAVLVSVVAFPIIMTVGGVVLNTHGNFSDWIIPWMIYILCSGGNFIMSTILSFFEGCAQVGKIQRNKLFGSIVTTVTTLTLLALKFGLYALAISAVLGFTVNAVLLFFKFKNTLIQLLKCKVEKTYPWFKEFMQLLWKYALSWASGYAIFQIYTPIAFMVYDPVQAGKVGITMTLIQACFSIANAWMSVATPKANMSVAKGQWKEAERILLKNTVLALGTFVLGTAAILGGYALFINHLTILQRFMGVKAMSIFLGAYLLQIPINAIAVYGRGHKREPFLIPSLVSAVLCISITLISVYSLPIDYIFLGYLCISIVALLFFWLICKKNKQIWHKEYEDNYINKIKLEEINERNNISRGSGDETASFNEGNK